MSWFSDFWAGNKAVKPKHIGGGAAVVSTALSVAVVNYTFPRLTVSEGLALVSYYDPWGKVWTNCIGNTVGAAPGQHFTKQECLDQTAARLPDYWVPMVEAAPVLGTSDVPVSFKAAWLQFTWNEGVGTFKRYIAPQINDIASRPGWHLSDMRAACDHMMNFTRAGNSPTLLLKRREREHADCVSDL